MSKKRCLTLLAFLFILAFALCLAFGFAACGGSDEDDGKTSDGQTSDAGDTGNTGSTEDEGGVETHTHTISYVEAKEAKCEEDGNTEYYYCSGCGKYFSDEKGETEIDSVIIPATGHTYVKDSAASWEWVGSDETGYTSAKAAAKCSVCQKADEIVAEVKSDHVDATCGDDAQTVYIATYGGSPVATKSVTETGTATGNHAYVVAENAAWSWVGNDTDGYTSATADATCSVCTKTGLTVTATVTSSIVSATCGEDGKTVYTASYKDEPVDTKEVTNSNDPATGNHTYVIASDATWSWVGDDTTGYTSATTTASCSVCGKENLTATATVTSSTVNATCGEDEKTVYTATFDNEPVDTKEVKSTTNLATGNHEWPTNGTDTGYITWDWENMNEDTETVVLTVICKVCGQELVNQDASTDAVNYTATGVNQQGCVIVTGTYSDGTHSYTDSYTIPNSQISIEDRLYLLPAGAEVTLTGADGTTAIFSNTLNTWMTVNYFIMDMTKGIEFHIGGTLGIMTAAQAAVFGAGDGVDTYDLTVQIPGDDGDDSSTEGAEAAEGDWYILIGLKTNVGESFELSSMDSGSWGTYYPCYRTAEYNGDLVYVMRLDLVYSSWSVMFNVKGGESAEYDIAKFTVSVDDYDELVWPYGENCDENNAIVSTASELATAINNADSTDAIVVVADITDTDGSVTSAINTYLADADSEGSAKSLKIIIAGRTLDLSSAAAAITVGNYNSLEISGYGYLILFENSSSSNQKSDGGIYVKSASTLTIDGMVVKATGTAVFPMADSSAVNISNSVIYTTGYYGVATNAGSGMSNQVKITIENSLVYANEATGDCAAVMINVPGELNITDSYIVAGRQGVIVRGGTAVIKDSTIRCLGTYSTKNKFENNQDGSPTGNWSSGNEVPAGALIVGNYTASTYQYASKVTLEGVTLVQDNASDWLIYAYSCSSACSVEINYDANCNFVITQTGADFSQSEGDSTPTDTSDDVYKSIYVNKTTEGSLTYTSSTGSSVGSTDSDPAGGTVVMP